MKKVVLLLVLFLSLFLLSCGNNEIKEENEEEQTKEQEKEQFVALDDNDIVLSIDKTYKLQIRKSDEATYSYQYNEEIIKVLDDMIVPSNVGKTTLSLYFDGKEIKTINVVIYEKPSELHFIDLPNQLKIGNELEIKTNSSDVLLEVKGTSALFDETTNKLKALATGEVEIIATYKYDKELVINKTIKIIDEEVPADFVYVDSTVEALDNEEVVIDNYVFVFGVNLFNYVEDALDYADEVVLGNITEETVTITKSNVTLLGNELSKPLDIRLTISSGVHDVVIKDLTFTNESKIILVNNNSNITIENNNFIDTVTSNKTWDATNKYTYGIIELSNSTMYHNNIVIKNNHFNNIGECGINISTTHNILIEGNEFNGFSRDGVRFNNGIIKEECTWSILKNHFIDGTYSALYFRTYGSDSSDIYHFVDIKENYFSSVGNPNEEFSSAITFRNYQEGGACVDIAYNTFNGCSKYIFLRNNAKKANQTNFTGFVLGNIFETVPSKYYFNNLNSSDSFSDNPKQTKLVNNAYLSDGKDTKPDDSKFIGSASNTRMSVEKVKKLYHFTLHHVMLVGKSVKNLDDVEEVDEGSFKFSTLAIEPLKSGTFILKHNDDTLEVKCIKKIEMIVRFINVALGELGYEEMDANGNTGTSGNYTKYGAWYGINPGAWCAMYVSWCANEAGVPTSIIPKYASVQIGMDWYKNKNLFQYKENYTPKAGDIMFMKSNGASHTGIVLYCDGKTLYTVEGNTSDKCALRKYDVNNAKITGYGTPEWPYYSPDGYNFSSGEAQDGSSHSTT